MRKATSKTRPRVSLRGPRRRLGSDQHLDKHWPGGAKIKMTLGLITPKGEANGKNQCWDLLEEFYSKQTVKGSHKSPNHLRNAKSGNITTV